MLACDIVIGLSTNDYFQLKNNQAQKGKYYNYKAQAESKPRCFQQIMQDHMGG